MIQINMLPWRERAREIKKKNFIVALGGAVGLTLFIIFIFHMYYNDLIAYQNKRNAFLQSEISQKQMELDELRKNKEQQGVIQVQLQFLMGLREKSYNAVRLLNEILKIVPDAITLSKLQRDGDAITIEGKAQSDLIITAFLKRISQNPFFSQPVLTGISSSANNTESSERYFQIKMEQRDVNGRGQSSASQAEKK